MSDGRSRKGRGGGGGGGGQKKKGKEGEGEGGRRRRRKLEGFIDNHIQHGTPAKRLRCGRSVWRLAAKSKFKVLSDVLRELAFFCGIWHKGSSMSQELGKQKEKTKERGPTMSTSQENSSSRPLLLSMSPEPPSIRQTWKQTSTPLMRKQPRKRTNILVCYCVSGVSSDSTLLNDTSTAYHAPLKPLGH